jgi:uncharacterized repeat protein (TIGR03803 family)
MKTYIKKLFILPGLAAVLGLLSAGRVLGQSFTNLYNFTARSDASPFTNSDGAYPSSALVLSGNTLYGLAGDGGSAGNGTVFAINTDGTGFTNLYSFTPSSGAISSNSDGANPFASLILSDDTLYGTAFDGGSAGYGTVFAINTTGTGFTNLHTFTGAAEGGGKADSSLVLSGNALYGTAELGGNSGNGMVFKVNTDGTGFTNLHGFTGGAGGSFPQAGLILSGSTLYGTAGFGGRGGNGGNGTVFSIKTDGTGFTNFYRFTGSNDGSYPQAGLILSGSTLYGTAEFGGSNYGSAGYGTVFAVNTNGTPFAVLHTFTATDPETLANSDGANPSASLFLSGNTLYGTAFDGGSAGSGTVFAVNTNGTDFTNLHSFTGGRGGSGPQAAVILSGNALYGTAEFDGSGESGTVFRLSLGPLGPLGAPQPYILEINASGTNLVINASDGQSGETYKTLVSTNLGLPLSQWKPLATNVLNASGDFTITLTNTVNRNAPQLFYVLQVQ